MAKLEKRSLSTMMTKEEYMALAEAKYQELQALKSKPTFYDYEKSFVDLWQDLGRLGAPAKS